MASLSKPLKTIQPFPPFLKQTTTTNLNKHLCDYCKTTKKDKELTKYFIPSTQNKGALWIDVPGSLNACSNF